MSRKLDGRTPLHLVYPVPVILARATGHKVGSEQRRVRCEAPEVFEF